MPDLSIRRFTIGGLGVALLLGAVALGIDLFVAAQRQEIIESGQRAEGLVVDMSDRLVGRSDDAVVEYSEGGRTHRVEISGAVGDGPGIGSRVELYYLPSDPGRVATTDGQSSLIARTAPFPFYIFAGVALIVTVTENVNEARRKRNRPPVVRRPRVWGGRRGVVRRNDWFSRIILGLGLIGLVLALWIGNPLGLFVSPIVVWGYLMGVSRRIVVTPEEVAVYRVFSVIRIPRHLISRVEPDRSGDLTIRLKGRDAVRFRVGISSVYDDGSGGYSRDRPLHKSIARLNALLEDVPELPNTGDPSVHRRWTGIIAAAASLGGFAWLTFQVFTGRIPSG